MSTFKMHQIEVDQEVYDFLKQHAEPFKDTPNSVIRWFLPMGSAQVINRDKDIRSAILILPESVPSALAQILEMIVLVKREGLRRIEATHTVADARRITIQAVIDKYTRQLRKKAFEIDELLMDSNIGEFKTLLIERFPHHVKVIEGTFDELQR